MRCVYPVSQAAREEEEAMGQSESGGGGGRGGKENQVRLVGGDCGLG